MPMNAAGRLDLMRKYGAIYGRFDSKRKNEKPMSLHEVHISTVSDLRGGGRVRRVDIYYLVLPPINNCQIIADCDMA